MKHRIIDQVLERALRAKEESDFTYFFSLLLAGEAVMKTITTALLAGIAEDPERHRYRLEHAVVRADGLGEWSKAVDDALTGPASQFLLADVRVEQTELTKLCRDGDWQYEAVKALRQAMAQLGIEGEELPVRSDMKRWFRLFATLRNKTRAHGATRSAAAGAASEHLAKSIALIYDQFSIFRRPWAYLYRNLSGKYRVSNIAGEQAVFEHLKKTSTLSLANGIYIHLGQPRLVPLVVSDPELQDVFLANGSFNGKRYELISYATDDRQEADASIYLSPPGTLPESETQGHGELLQSWPRSSEQPHRVG